MIVVIVMETPECVAVAIVAKYNNYSVSLIIFIHYHDDITSVAYSCS